jgi:serine/threonine-protein kinase
MITLTLLNPKTSTEKHIWTFVREDQITIGRSTDNDVVLENYPQVSRHHLQLQCPDLMQPEHWKLVSQGTNGTFLNGVLVIRGLISDQALIQLAQDGPLLQFHLQPTIIPAQSLPTASSSRCTHTGNHPQNLFCIHCGVPLVEKQQFVRQYQILRTLGQGGMGTTYLAWDKAATMTAQAKLLVLKEMNPNLEQVSKAQELFRREARILKTLNHPGIPQYYDFFCEQQKNYLAMELVHGQDLEKRVMQQGPVAVEQAIEWMLQVCDILSYLHALNPPLVHRDVKPANIIIRGIDNRAMLLDFGAVKEIGTPPGTCIGAEGYSAPEQERGHPCPQSDLYAIGPTLVFLLTGREPLNFYNFRGGGSRFNFQDIPTIPPYLQQVIEEACQIKLKQRYTQATDLAAALAACLLRQ